MAEFTFLDDLLEGPEGPPGPAGPPGAGYATVQDEGVSVTQRTVLNFVGSGVTVADVGGKTQVTVSGGGGGGLTPPADPGDDGKVAIAQDGDLTYDLIGNAQVSPTAGIAVTKLANIASDRLLGRDTASSGAIEELTVGGGIEFTSSGGIQRSAVSGDITIAAGSGTAAITADSIVNADVNSAAAIALSKLAPIATDRLLGRDTTGSGAIEEIALDSTLVWSGSGGIGRAAVTGDVTIAAGSNTAAIGTGVIVNADVNASAAIALSKLATQAALSVVANATNGTAVPTAVTAASDGLVFCRTGTALGFSTIATGGITDGAVTLAKLANTTALSVLGNGTNASAAVTALAAATDGDVMRRSGTTVGFGAPNFAAQTITTTGNIVLGTNPASSGLIRIPQGGDIVSRNAANSGNVPILYVSGSDGIIIGGTGAASVSLAAGTTTFVLGSTSVSTTAANWRWAPAVASPALFQDDQTTASTNGQHLLVQGQNATGATSTGGDLRLRSGTGTTASGALRLYAGANNQMSIFDTGIDINTAQLAFTSSVSNPVFGQNTLSTATATGQPFLLRAQDCSGTTAVTAGALTVRAGNATGGSGTRNGGALNLASGTGATSDGNVTISRGATAVLSATSTGTGIGNSTILVEGASLSGRKVVSLARGAAVSATQVPSGDGVLYLGQCTTAPSSNPLSGVVQWVDSSGNLWSRGPTGTITQLAVA